MRATGNAFESAAEAHAVAQGVRVLDRNVSCRYGEIDLVFLEREVLVFAEVRYRDNPRFGGAAQSVDSRKQQRIIAAAQFYLQSHPTLARHACRFDVFALQGAAENPQIDWIRDAFRVEA